MTVPTDCCEKDSIVLLRVQREGKDLVIFECHVCQRSTRALPQDEAIVDWNTNQGKQKGSDSK